MNLNIQFDESLPVEHQAMAERSLRTAIDFLDSRPRPMAHPPIEFFTPDWEKMEFKIGGDTWARGLFSTKSMKGWCILTVRLNNDLVLMTDPLTTFLNQDLEVATTCSMVSTLDGAFYLGIHFDRQLQRQLQYLDSIAPENAKAKSLVDEYEEQQKAQAEAERYAAYKAQWPEKRRLQSEKHYRDTVSKVPAWYAAKYPNSPILDGPHEIIGASAPSPTYSTTTTPLQPVVTTTAPAPAPTPTTSPYEKEIIAEQEAMWNFIRSRSESCDTVCGSTEDFDK